MWKPAIALLSLLIGGLIYILWRSDTLLMFTWFDRIGLASLVVSLRGRTGGSSTSLPGWIIFSVPNGLWLFSGLLAFDSIWATGAAPSKAFWLLAFWLTAIGGEVGQAWRIVPGTFDWPDMSAIILAGAITFLVIFGIERQGRRREL